MITMKKKKNYYLDVKVFTIVILVVVILVLLGFVFDFKMFVGSLDWLSFNNIFWALAVSTITSIALLFLEKKLIKKSDDPDYEALTEEIKKFITDNNQNIITRMNMYSPLKSYSASDTPIDEYNDIIDKEFTNSEVYRYMGDRARYLAYRLDKLKGEFPKPGRARGLDVEVLLPNIENDYFVTAQIDSLKMKPDYIGIADIKMLTAKMVKDYKISIVESLCAFYHLSNHYQFNIYFYDDLPFIRYELLGNVMVLSLLTMDSTKTYPPTFIYSKDSSYYKAFSQYHYNMIELSKIKKLRHFDNSTLSLESIREYALRAKLTADDLEGVIK